MHLSRTISAVLTTLMLMTTELFCNTSVNAESFGMRMKTGLQHSTTSDHTVHRYVAGDRHQRNNPAATPLCKRATALFIGVRCMPKLFPESCRQAGVADSTSANNAIFKGKMSCNSTAATSKRQQALKTARYWLRTSLIRVSPGAGPNTATTTRTDTRRRRWITDDAPELQQRQSTWSINQDAVEEKARRDRRWSPTSSQEQITVGKSWTGRRQTTSAS